MPLDPLDNAAARVAQSRGPCTGQCQVARGSRVLSRTALSRAPAASCRVLNSLGLSLFEGTRVLWFEKEITRRKRMGSTKERHTDKLEGQFTGFKLHQIWDLGVLFQNRFFKAALGWRSRTQTNTTQTHLRYVAILLVDWWFDCGSPCSNRCFVRQRKETTPFGGAATVSDTPEPSNYTLNKDITQQKWVKHHFVREL